MRSRRNKRGVGAILAASFILLILVLGFSVFLVIQDQMGGYQESVAAVNTLEFERGRENVVILGDPTSTLTGGALDLAVENRGFIEVRLIYIGVFNTSAGDDVHDYSPIDYMILPGGTVSGITSPVSLSSSVNYTVQLLSDRGVVASISAIEGSLVGGEGDGGDGGDGTSIVAPVTQEYISFEWATYSDSLEGMLPTDPSLVWNVGGIITSGSSGSIVWKVIAQNQFSQNITLNPFSVFGLRPMVGGGGGIQNWWIINTEADGTFSSYSDPDANVMTLQPGVTVTLYFASANRDALVPMGIPDRCLYSNLTTLSGTFEDGTAYSSTLLPLFGVQIEDAC